MAETHEKYDVFISFKNTDPNGGLTVDRTIAQRLHDKLLDEGLNVFFSEKDLSDTAFVDEIFTALNQAELLIVVGTSVDYVTSRWVKSEWTHFFGAINSGKKQDGRIMTVLHGIVPNDLPLPLSNFQSFNAAALDEAVAYAFRTLGRISNTQAREWEKAENERKLKEAEAERLKAVKARMEAEQREKQEKEAAETARKKAADEQKKRLAAEEKAKKATRRGRKGIVIGIVTAVLAVALIGGAALMGLFKPEWEYTVSEDGTAAVTAYNGNETEVIIPQELKGHKVTIIGENAFYGCSSLTSVTIPDGVTSIGQRAFFGCSSLSSVTIPDSVTSIAHGAFMECSSLTSMTIPDSVESIGEEAFKGCSSLTVYAPHEKAYYNSSYSIGDVKDWIVQ